MVIKLSKLVQKKVLHKLDINFARNVDWPTQIHPCKCDTVHFLYGKM